MFFRVVSSVVFAGGTIFSTIFFWESVFLDDLKLFFYSTEKFDQDVYVLSASFFFLSLAIATLIFTALSMYCYIKTFFISFILSSLIVLFLSGAGAFF